MSVLSIVFERGLSSLRTISKEYIYKTVKNIDDIITSSVDNVLFTYLLKLCSFTYSETYRTRKILSYRTICHIGDYCHLGFFCRIRDYRYIGSFGHIGDYRYIGAFDHIGHLCHIRAFGYMTLMSYRTFFITKTNQFELIGYRSTSVSYFSFSFMIVFIFRYTPV